MKILHGEFKLYLYIYMNVIMCVCMYVCMSVCMCVCLQSYAERQVVRW